MQKVVIHRPGGYEQLKLEEHPTPTPGMGEVLVNVAAIGVNFADCCVRFGVYDSAKKYVGWPITPGFEFAGRVAAVGPSATRFQPGDQVLGVIRFGAYAEQVVAPSDQLFPLPGGWSLEQAAGFPTVFLTAYHALRQCVQLRAGNTVLVHSAAGGVGSALTQIAKLFGCRVIGVVGRAEKVAVAEANGCDIVIDKRASQLWPAVEAAAPEGVDVICDANGPATLAESFRHLRPFGRLLVYGFHTMLPLQGGRVNYWQGLWGLIKVPRFNPFNLVSQNKGVIGFNLSYLFDRHDLLAPAWHELFQWVDEGKIHPLPVTTYPLRNVAQAHEAIESGRTTGKLVLIR